MLAVVIVFWAVVALLVYTQVGYQLLLAVLSRLARSRPPAATWTGELPPVTVIVAAYNEQEGIAARVANLKALAYPQDRLQVIVASDGSSDATVARAREAGAELVLELPRGGKIRAQDASVEQATGELLVF